MVATRVGAVEEVIEFQHHPVAEFVNPFQNLGHSIPHGERVDRDLHDRRIGHPLEHAAQGGQEIEERQIAEFESIGFDPG